MYMYLFTIPAQLRRERELQSSFQSHSHQTTLWYVHIHRQYYSL